MKMANIAKYLQKYDVSYGKETFLGGDVFLTTNDAHSTFVLEELAKLKKQKRAIHVGVSCWYNFDIMWARQSECALLFDINAQNKTVLKETLTLLKENATRETFIKAFLAFCKKHEYSLSIFTDTNELEKDLAAQLKRDQGWLGSSVSFDYIRGMALADKIGVIRQDIRYPKVFEAIRRVLEDNGFVVDTLYVSNIAKYMKHEKEKDNYDEREQIEAVNFKASILALMCDTTLLIHAPYVRPTDLYDVLTMGRMGFMMLLSHHIKEQLEKMHGSVQRIDTKKDVQTISNLLFEFHVADKWTG